MSTGVILTNQGKAIILNRAFKSVPDYTNPSVFKVGTGTSTPGLADTDLQTAITISGNPTKIFLSGYPILDEPTLSSSIRTNLLTTECNGNNISEFGIFNTDSTNKCFSRAVFTPITKNNTTAIIFFEKDKVL